MSFPQRAAEVESKGWFAEKQLENMKMHRPKLGIKKSFVIHGICARPTKGRILRV